MEQPEQFDEDTVQETIKHITSEYLNKVLTGYAMFLPDYKEIDYIRTPFETPTGGIYVVALMHVMGPKINLDDIRKVINEKAKAGESENVVLPQEEVQQGPSTGEST